MNKFKHISLLILVMLINCNQYSFSAEDEIPPLIHHGGILDHEALPLLEEDHVDEQLQEYYYFTVRRSLAETETCPEKTVKTIGQLFGAISASCMVILGKDFWLRSVPSPAEAWILDIVSVIPIFALFSTTTKDTFASIYNEIWMNPVRRAVNGDKSNVWRISQVTSALSGAIMAIGATYLTDIYFSNPYPSVGATLAVFTFVAQTTAGHWAVSSNLSNINKYFCKQAYINVGDETPRSRLGGVLIALDKMKRYVSSRTNEQLEEEYIHTLLGLEDEDDIEAPGVIAEDNEFNLALRGALFTLREKSEGVTQPSIIRKYFGYLGWGVGLIGGWTVQPVVKTGAEALFNNIIGENPAIVETLSEAVSISAGITWSSLTSLSTKNFTEKMYDKGIHLFNNGISFDLPSLKVYTKNLIFGVLGGMSATPRVEMGIQYLPDIPIIKTLILTCCALSRLGLGYDFLERFFNSPNINNNKTSILKLINLLESEVTEFHPVVVDRLHEIFYEEIDEEEME